MLDLTPIKGRSVKAIKHLDRHAPATFNAVDWSALDVPHLLTEIERLRATPSLEPEAPASPGE